MRRWILALMVLGTSAHAPAQLGGLLNKKKDTGSSDTTVQKSSSIESADKKKTPGFLQKLSSEVSKVAGGLVSTVSGMTSIGNLQDADVIVSVGTHIYSRDLGLIFNSFLGKEWVDNGDFTMLQIASKDAYQFYKYDGTITVNDKELKHAAMGIHTATEIPGKANKKITFTKNGTVDGSFEVPLPPKNIRLLSINGKTGKVDVDFTKDVVLAFADYSTNPESLIRVDVITTQIGIRALSMVCYVKPAATVTIPAEAFRNIENKNNFTFKDCYLSVSDQLLADAINPTGAIPKNQKVITGSNDGMWVNVTASKENSKGILFETGNAKVEKGNAAYAPPLSFAKKVAVSSFYTYGTTYLYDRSSNNWTQSTTTKTIEFPDIPDSYLDGMLAGLYQKITGAFTEVTGGEVMPAKTVPATKSYATTASLMKAEVNNDGEFLRVYEGLKPMRSLTTVANTYYGESQLIKEANANALLKVSLACALSWEKKPEMTPYLTIELVGIANGDFRSFAGNTKYFTINIAGKPYEIKKKEAVNFDELFQVDVFAAQFKTALAELKNKEAALGEYETIWRLQ